MSFKELFLNIASLLILALTIFTAIYWVLNNNECMQRDKTSECTCAYSLLSGCECNK